jgi:hypothetical protein
LFKALIVRGTPAQKKVEYMDEMLTLKERLAKKYGEEYVQWLIQILDEVKAPKPG